METKYKTHRILEAVLLVFVLAALPMGNLWANENTKYLDAVREFADNVLKYGRDTYGPKRTPLFVDGLNIHNHEPVKWIAPNGDRWILSNLASQQNLFRTLDGLTKITGDPKYRQAAVEAIEHAFANLRSPNGLLYWGGLAAYDAQADKVCRENGHVFKAFYPYYELMWQVNPEATRQIIESLWASHILDWSNLDMDRIAPLDRSRVPKGWEQEYKPGPVFFASSLPWGNSFFTTGSDLFYAATILSELSGKDKPLVWAKRIARRYIETRDPKTGISAYKYSLSGDEAKQKHCQLSDDFKGHKTVSGRIFVFADYPSVQGRRRALGFDTRLQSWACELMLGDWLGERGQEFRRWSLEELTAWGKVAYRKEDNSWVPMLTDGTSLEGYVLKEDGYMGAKGMAFRATPVGPVYLWAYALAYRVTADSFMWEMVRNIALGNGFGDIGPRPNHPSSLTRQTAVADPYALLGFLELYRKTGRKAFLEMATGIGDNILAERFQNGFFVSSKKHIYARFDDLEPMVLLHLYGALNPGRASLPAVWPGESHFFAPYRGLNRPVFDLDLIYSLTETPVPPKTLHEAAALGEVSEVRRLLAGGIDVNTREAMGWVMTALHPAAMKGHKEVVELLLDHGADINARDSFVASPLHYAAEEGHKEVIKLLVAKGADLEARTATGDTPLHYATRSRSVDRDVIELLIANGANVNAKNSEGQTPIDLAMNQGRKEIAKLLLSKSGDVSLHTAAYLGDLQRVEKFIDDGANVDAKDQKGQTALHYAAKTGQISVAKLLIAHGANVNGREGYWTPLQEATYYSKEMVELLLAKGANINAGKWTALHSALDAERFDIVELLVAKGADVNIKDGKGRTPLHIAAWYAASKNPKIVELLLSNGADINAKDKNGKTALSYAIENGHTEIVELLRKHGAKE